MQFLSIDPGGTKCEMCLSDENGNILGYNYSSCNVLENVDIDKFKETSVGYGRNTNMIADSIIEICKDINTDDLHIICGGAVGALITVLKEKGFKYASMLYSSEQCNAFYSAGFDKGYIVLSGTGAFVYSNVAEEPFNLDGLGPILGDNGGSCEIGLKALRAVIKSEWASDLKTSLAPRINKIFTGEETNNRGFGLYKYLYDFPNRTILGALAKVVNEEAEKGDRIAIKILKEASKDLAETLRCSIGLSGNKSEYPVICYGGVISKSKIYYEIFKREIFDYYPNLNVILLDIPSCLGGNIYLAENVANKDLNEFRKILKKNFFEYMKKKK